MGCSSSKKKYVTEVNVNGEIDVSVEQYKVQVASLQHEIFLLQQTLPQEQVAAVQEQLREERREQLREQRREQSVTGAETSEAQPASSKSDLPVAEESMAKENECNEDKIVEDNTKVEESTQPHLETRKSLVDIAQDLNTGDRYDLIVLGAGPVGVKAAVECANRGFRVGLVDPKDVITGVPTGAHSKCLREAVLEGARTWSEVEGIVNKVVKRAQEATAKLLETFHVDVLKGSGSFLDHETILLRPPEGEPRNLKADCIVIATGSRANRVPDVPFHLPGVFESDSIFGISYLPKKMIVQGAGIIGLEYALIFALLGSKVAVVHRSGDMAPMLDKDLRQALRERLEKEGVEIRLNTPLKSVTAADGSSAESPALLVDIGTEVLECDCFLSATGRGGASKGLGLEKVDGVKVGRGNMIEVDNFQHTGVGNIYAVGDVAGGGLATQGQAQAMRAIRKHFGVESDTEHKEVKPCGVWTIPEIAWAGMTEDEAVKKGIEIGTSREDYGATIRGIVVGDTGFLKLIFDKKDGKVLGVHICGDNACDLVNYGAEVVNDGDTIEDMLKFVFPAVTYHELYHLAAHKAQIYLRGAKSLSAATAWNRIRVSFNKGGLSEKELLEAFQTFDTDGSGSLHAEELYQAFQMMGLRLSNDVVKEMVDEVDDSGDGHIDYQELKKIIGL